jgi:uncharacterized membrane protein YgcG
MAEHPEWVTRLLSDEDLDAIAAAVAAAERRTSAQVRVHLERRCVGDPIAHATHVFHRLGMHRTRHRNGVLLFLSLGDRKFAIVGDHAIHDRVGHGFWDSVRDVLQAELRAGRMREGITAAVAEIGRALGAHFPDRPDDTNELPDRVSLW